MAFCQNREMACAMSGVWVKLYHLFLWGLSDRDIFLFYIFCIFILFLRKTDKTMVKKHWALCDLRGNGGIIECGGYASGGVAAFAGQYGSGCGFWDA